MESRRNNTVWWVLEELFSAAEGERAEPKGEESAGGGGDDPEAAVVAVWGLGVEAEVSPQAEQQAPRHQTGDDVPEEPAVGGFVLHAGAGNGVSRGFVGGVSDPEAARARLGGVSW